MLKNKPHSPLTHLHRIPRDFAHRSILSRDQASNKPGAVQIDLASEAGRTIAQKATTYLEHYRSGREQHSHGTYPRVLWLAPDERRASQIQYVLDAKPDASRLCTVCLFNDATDLLASEARA